MRESELFADYPVTWILVECVKCGALSDHPADSDLSLAVCEKCHEDQSPEED